MVTLLLSRLGGWRRLASMYRLSGAFSGKVWRFQSGKFNWAGYNNCLSVGANEKGLYIAALFIFRAGHPPPVYPMGRYQGKEEEVPCLDVLRHALLQGPGGAPANLRATVEPHRSRPVSGGKAGGANISAPEDRAEIKGGVFHVEQESRKITGDIPRGCRGTLLEVVGGMVGGVSPPRREECPRPMTSPCPRKIFSPG